MRGCSSMNAASNTFHFDVFKQESEAFYEPFPGLCMLQKGSALDAIRKQESEYVTEGVRIRHRKDTNTSPKESQYVTEGVRIRHRKSMDADSQLLGVGSPSLRQNWPRMSRE